jgi:hypothetical protein
MLNHIKEKIFSFAENRFSSPLVITLLIIVIAFIAFGVKTLSLGLFNDDWHHVYYAYLYGVKGLKQFLFFDSRPLAFTVYGPLFSLLGFKALNWHLTVLFLRVITVLIFWLVLNRIWTENKKENGLVALLFLVYPAFQLQPIAVAYTMHWLLYALFMLSLFFMILSVQDSRRFIPFTALSLLFEIFHLVVFEYFAGAELIRPFLLWLILRDLPVKERLKKTILYWLPYLMILAIYAVFRASYSSLLGYDRNTPVILLGLFTTPLTSILFLLQTAVKDFIDVLLSVWNDAYKPINFDMSKYSNIWVFLLSVFSALLVWLGFLFIQKKDSEQPDSQYLWGRTVLIFGAIFLFVGFLPPWFAGRTFFDTYDALDDRLVLPGIYGASMIWVGVIFYLVRKKVHRYLLVSILLGLAVGLQLRTNNQYIASWRKQSQFYWQLYWRAPSIEPNTAFISEGEILPLMGVHPTIYAINLLYPSSDTSKQEFRYGLFVSGEGIGNSWEKFRQGMTLEDTRFGTDFEGSSKDTLTVLFNMEGGECLWVLRPEDKYISNLPELTYESMPMSNLSRISQDPASNQPVPSDVFGTEPAHTWCFYYEKAELARQYQNWPEVTRLWDESQKQGFSPDNGNELLVFIDGFMATNNWEQALNLTLKSNKYGNNIRPTLCEFWIDRLAKTDESPERQKAVNKVNDKLGCFP